jgi:hypothetical protein
MSTLSIREKFTVPKRYNTIAYTLMAVGIISIIVLYIYTHKGGGTEEYRLRRDARFWASCAKQCLLPVGHQRAMFFFCATTLAWAGFQMSFRRVTEAISTCVPVLG